MGKLSHTRDLSTVLRDDYNIILNIGDIIISADSGRYEGACYQVTDLRLTDGTIYIHSVRVRNGFSYNSPNPETVWNIKQMLERHYDPTKWGAVFRGTIENLERLFAEGFKALPIIESEETGLTLRQDQLLSNYLTIWESYNRASLQMAIEYTRAEKQKHDMQQSLERMRTQIEAQVRPLQSKLKIANMLLTQFETLLGKGREIHTLVTGDRAPLDTPIDIWENVFHMKETYIDPTDKGMHGEKVDSFFQWLKEHNTFFNCKNYEWVIPGTRSISLWSARKNPLNRPWMTDTLAYAQLAESDTEAVYVVVRDGHNVWVVLLYLDERVFDFGGKLIPNPDEIFKMQSEALSEAEKYSYSKWEKVAEVERSVFSTRLKAAFIESLFRDASMFPDLPPAISMLNENVTKLPGLRFNWNNIRTNEIGATDAEDYRTWAYSFYSEPAHGLVFWNNATSFARESYLMIGDRDTKWLTIQTGLAELQEVTPENYKPGTDERDYFELSPRQFYLKHGVLKRFSPFVGFYAMLRESDAYGYGSKKRIRVAISDKKVIDYFKITEHDTHVLTFLLHRRDLRVTFEDVLADLYPAIMFKKEVLKEEERAIQFLADSFGMDVVQFRSLSEQWKAKTKTVYLPFNDHMDEAKSKSLWKFINSKK